MGAVDATRPVWKSRPIQSRKIFAPFDEYKILHLSDLHVDMNEEPMKRVEAILPALEYDICVLTGDYRGHTFGPYEAALAGM
jgi:predicted MPP superfamily phosphohydrolase